MELVTPAIGLMFWTCVVFSLLLILLKKFAWKPILSAVDERNSGIEEALALAKKTKDFCRRVNTECVGLTGDRRSISGIYLCVLDRCYMRRGDLGWR